ncbi:DUF1566 domain-containing protein [Xanthomonas sacchari]|uniref:Lcl C-terminal domain-containing protein n=1 Tax=Xanthomonas sacchari TaxID=56458 RepID=UPI00225DFD43|nr:DUF1566 domain-containing protein [Xanthomonas sacchari]UYK82278.1 DUF1566 domain-containing protein [Xanthomonas sacchari]
MTIITIHTGDTELTIRSVAQPVATLETMPALEEPLYESSARFTKIAADGKRLPEGDTRTDHAAVIDNTTGLMWSARSCGDPENEDDGISQEHCIERCKQLALLGHKDWRLPTRAELVGLIDDTRHEPAIDTDAFPGVKPQWHWTSTPAAWSSASAWCVNFDSGLVVSAHRRYDGFALAVRRAGQ